ncbi:MAG: HD-GYP domain-containing protein [Oscillospiraceae bacterium]|nr:HD-GYP domain-containing protein [Oscillospiraceae bacterium]
MNSRIYKINRNLVVGWMIIVLVLFVAYLGEVLKGERTVTYLCIFMAMTAIPAFFTFFLYLKKPDRNDLRYYIVVGYFFLYIFAMMSGSTTLVFCYILPMLSLLVLYHQPNIILFTGIASFIINIISIVNRIFIGSLTMSNSKEAEIQIALLLLCFGGSYAAAKLYDEITRQNRAYFEMLNEKNTQTIETIAHALEAKDAYTRGHSQRVAAYSVQIAKELGLPEEDVKNIRTVALLHDIGKIGIPDSVLNKPGKLTDEEYNMMKLHPVTGCEIMKDINSIPGVHVGTKYHHERYDGKGYPEGLSGDNIPYIARVIAVADAYDAMTSTRVYRKRLSDEEVMSELENGVGTQFDPNIAKTLIKLIKSDKLKNVDPCMPKSA